MTAWLTSAGERFANSTVPGLIVSVDFLSLNWNVIVVPSRVNVCGPSGDSTAIFAHRPCSSGMIVIVDSTVCPAIDSATSCLNEPSLRHSYVIVTIGSSLTYSRNSPLSRKPDIVAGRPASTSLDASSCARIAGPLQKSAATISSKRQSSRVFICLMVFMGHTPSNHAW